MTTQNHHRRAWMLGAIATLGGLVCALPAQAEQYPNRTIKIVVPFAAGGGGDILGRLIAKKLSEQFKQPVIVDNKPGASGIIGSDAVAKSPPDGYTILLNVPLLVQTATLYKKLPYDPLADFTPIVDLISSPVWFAVGADKVKAETLKDYQQLAKANPKDFSYASIGQGSAGHLLGFGLNDAMQLSTIHIPYKGAAPAIQALLSGEVASAFLDLVPLKPQVAAGKVRLLAVTGTQRSELTPSVPTLAELGYPGFETGSWAGLFVPSKTPADIVKRLEEAVRKSIADPEYVAAMTKIGYTPGAMSQAQFATYVRSEYTAWGSLIKKTGVVLD